MRSKRQGAAAPTTAQTSKQQCRSYPNRARESRENLKHEIAELLFCLELPVGHELSQVGWVLFEWRLRQYIDFIHTGRAA